VVPAILALMPLARDDLKSLFIARGKPIVPVLNSV
jgi:hypothetical protein